MAISGAVAYREINLAGLALVLPLSVAGFCYTPRLPNFLANFDNQLNFLTMCACTGGYNVSVLNECIVKQQQYQAVGSTCVYKLHLFTGDLSPYQLHICF